MDACFGRYVRGLMDGLGLAAVGHDGVTWSNHGGEVGARFLQMGFALGQKHWIAAAGILTEDDCADFERWYQDPSFTFVDQTIFGAWRRRASDWSLNTLRALSPRNRAVDSASRPSVTIPCSALAGAIIGQFEPKSTFDRPWPRMYAIRACG